MSIQDIMEWLEDDEIEDFDLEDLVLDAFESNASTINNKGMEAQLESLMQHYGGEDQLKRALAEAFDLKLPDEERSNA